MNEKWRRKRSWPNFKYHPNIFSNGRKFTKTSQSRQSVSVPILELTKQELYPRDNDIKLVKNLPFLHIPKVHCHEEFPSYWDIKPCSPLKVNRSIGGSSETSVHCQRNIWRYILEDGTLHNHRCESLKSFTSMFTIVHHWPLLWVRWIKSHFSSLKSVFILSPFTFKSSEASLRFRVSYQIPVCISHFSHECTHF
jgi:hypothetical protein